MKFQKIKSFAKLNLSLNVLGKLKTGLHKIESLFLFTNLYDEIYIKEKKTKNHRIIFSGKFSKGIPKRNTISILLKILEKKKLLKKKYLIKVIKKIPQKSGMGGGSMNAASLIKYFSSKNIINLSKKDLNTITETIGSDVKIGLFKCPVILNRDNKVQTLNKKFLFYLLLIRPNFGCSTAHIYKHVRKYSKPNFKNNKNLSLNDNAIRSLNNDLEEKAFKIYPKLKEMKLFLNSLDKIFFARMTGSGSTIVGYFKSKKAAINAKKILKKKYKNYWCILSKTI